MERARERTGAFGSDPEYGLNGMFHINGLKIIASDGHDALAQGWEHVSVSCSRRTPTWAEMCFVKNQFWGPDECVVQFHPEEKNYVNHHPYCLHLWKSKTKVFPIPPTFLVGPK
jgi:hypothetical protein